MGDEPLSALLPLVVFAVVDRGSGEGTTWAAIAALITVVTLLLTSTRTKESPNILLRGAFVWFVALGIAGWISPHGWLDHYGRAVAAGGYALIALSSLLYAPFSEHYARLRIRRRYWSNPHFHHLNRVASFTWGCAMAVIACSFALGAVMDSRAGATVFFWVLPIAIAMLAVHRCRLAGEDFFEHCPARVDNAMWDVLLDTSQLGHNDADV
jgi:hypothetical protein